MITAKLVVTDNIEDIYRIFLAEKLESKRAKCTVKLGKELVFEVKAKDPTSMKAFMNSILNVIEIYSKIK